MLFFLHALYITLCQHTAATKEPGCQPLEAFAHTVKLTCICFSPEVYRELCMSFHGSTLHLSDLVRAGQ